MQWALDHIQYLHLAVFAVASISVEWRKPGLILAGFALLYLTLTPFHAVWKEADPSLFMLMYVMLDMLGAFLIFDFCRPSKSNTKFKTKHWLGLSGILIAFWVAHYLNFCYTMGYSVSLSPPIYNWLTLGLAVATLFIAAPGAKEGAYEVKRLVNQKLARVCYSGSGHSSTPDPSCYRRPEHSQESGDSSGGSGSDTDPLVVHSRGVHSGRGKT